MFAELSRVSMYYENYGNSRNVPVVLLHGGASGASTWVNQINALEDRYHLYVPEQQGHCRTADTTGPLSYQAMANDTIEFLERVVGGRSHLIGHSDGGIISLLIALQRPDLIHRVVAIGANYHKDGLLQSSSFTENAESEAFASARERYSALSPDGPSHWAIVVRKLQEMWFTEPTLTLAELSTIHVPLLVMVGDDDVVGHSHSIALYEALPEGQMAIIPGTTHSVKKEKPGIVNGLILDFLADDTLPSTLKLVRTLRNDVEY